MSVFLKDPDAVLDYSVDWSANGYLQAGESIVTSAWEVSPTGELAIDSDANDNTTATVFVSAGARGGVYRLANRITTNQGRTDDRSLTVRVEPR